LLGYVTFVMQHVSDIHNVYSLSLFIVSLYKITPDTFVEYYKKDKGNLQEGYNIVAVGFRSAQL
jgi:hypothetical protein